MSIKSTTRNESFDSNTVVYERGKLNARISEGKIEKGKFAKNLHAGPADETVTCPVCGSKLNCESLVERGRVSSNVGPNAKGSWANNSDDGKDNGLKLTSTGRNAPTALESDETAVESDETAVDKVSTESETILWRPKTVRNSSRLWMGIPEAARKILRKRKFELVHDVSKNGEYGFRILNEVESGFEERLGEIGLKCRLVVDRNSEKDAKEVCLRKILQSVNDSNVDSLLSLIRGTQLENGRIDAFSLFGMLKVISANKADKENIKAMLEKIRPGELSSLAKEMSRESQYILDLMSDPNFFNVSDGCVKLHPHVKAYLNIVLHRVLDIDLTPSKKSRVRNIEKLVLKRYGTMVSFADDLPVAKGFLKASEMVRMAWPNFKFPPCAFIGDAHLKGGCCYNLAYDGKPAPIILSHSSGDAGDESFESRCTELYGAKYYPEIGTNSSETVSSSNMGTVLHEFGHVFHEMVKKNSNRVNTDSGDKVMKTVDMEDGYGAKIRDPRPEDDIDFYHKKKFRRYARNNSEKKPKALAMSRHIRDTVSEYALNEEDGSDFVAEVFCGLAIGKKFDKKIMNLYKKLDGPEPDYNSLKKESKIADWDEEVRSALTITKRSKSKTSKNKAK
ncbi:MAG: hypothetical protein LBB18_02035 [Puniceicoccales bacterium]|jgi:hypothetical protein|nr:hypothetical protein [Puniceicoccales bacterium]